MTSNLVFSFDFELGWGSIENGLWATRQESGVFYRCREFVPRLVDLLDDYEIPSAWATVGALVDNPEKRKFEHLPDHYRRVIQKVLGMSQSMTFDGRDLYEKVVASKNAKVSCHTYSHMRANYNAMSDEIMKKELDIFYEAIGGALQHPFFVFPQNIEGYHDVISKSGYDVARRTEYKNTNRAASLFRRYFFPSATSEVFRHSSGLVMKRGNLFFNCGIGSFKKKLWPKVLRQARSNIHNLSRSGGEYHIWNHPFNFAEHQLLYDEFKELIKYVSDLRDKGVLSISLP